MHDVEVFSRDKPIEKHATNSYASPTPILEGGPRVRPLRHDGHRLPRRTLRRRSSGNRKSCNSITSAGPGSSPAIFGNLLLFNCDGIDVQYGAALNKNTGALVWKTARSGVINKPNDRKKAFATPLVIRTGDRDQVIMTAAEWVYAYDPRTGDEIWNVKHPGFSVAPRPVFGHGLVYISSGYILPELLAIRPEGTGDITASTWSGRPTRACRPSRRRCWWATSCICSPTAAWSRATTPRPASSIGDSGSAAIFRPRRSRSTAASIAAARTAARSCLPPATEYQELALNQLDGRFMASPAVAGKALYLRTDTHLYRIEELLTSNRSFLQVSRKAGPRSPIPAMPPT